MFPADQDDRLVAEHAGAQARIRTVALDGGPWMRRCGRVDLETRAREHELGRLDCHECEVDREIDPRKQSDDGGEGAAGVAGALDDVADVVAAGELKAFVDERAACRSAAEATP